MQWHQQALLIVIGLALLPQGVELIQHVELGTGVQGAVEHLNAAGLAHGQDQRQVLVFQCHRVKVQRTVVGPLLAQVIQQRRQVVQRHVADLAGHQFQHVVMLLDLDQVAMIEPAE
ncbi:hypothetical protein D3C72_2040390 [compost metagenome]